MRQSKRVRVLSKRSRGRLVSRLVSPEAMSKAHRSLFRSSQRYFVVVTRSGLNWDTGDLQSPTLLLTESDDIELENLDPRFLKARRIEITSMLTDGGLLRLRLDWASPSKWEVLNESPQTRTALRAFDDALKEGIRSRLLVNGPFLLAVLVCWPFIWRVASRSLVLFLDPGYRKYVNATPAYRQGHTEVVPWWVSATWRLAIYSWPATLLGVGIIQAIFYKAGALKVWPESLSVGSRLRIAYRVRVGLPAWLGWDKMVPAVIGAVITAVFLRIAHLR